MMLSGREVVSNVLMNGLYYQDTVDRAIVLINNFTENSKVLILREYKGAKAAWRPLGLMGYLPEWDFTNVVSSNMIKNYPVTPRNIKIANKNFDPNVPCMKGK